MTNTIETAVVIAALQNIVGNMYLGNQTSALGLAEKFLSDAKAKADAIIDPYSFEGNEDDTDWEVIAKTEEYTYTGPHCSGFSACEDCGDICECAAWEAQRAALIVNDKRYASFSHYLDSHDAAEDIEGQYFSLYIDGSQHTIVANSLSHLCEIATGLTQSVKSIKKTVVSMSTIFAMTFRFDFTTHDGNNITVDAEEHWR